MQPNRDNQANCQQCGKPLRGNENKKFCDDFCKNKFHNTKRKKENEDIGKIITILKDNWRILGEVLDGKQVQNVSERALQDSGFVFRYHTHSRINKGDDKEYIFCFNYGYRRLNNGWYQVVVEIK